MHAIDDQTLYDDLAELDVVPKDKLNAAFRESKTQKKSFYKILLDKDLVSDHNLGGMISDHLGVPFIDLTNASIPKDILHIIPEVVAKKQRVISYVRGKDGIKLAMENPKNEEIQRLIAKKTGDKVIPYFATEVGIDSAIALYKEDMAQSFDTMLKEQVSEAGKDEKKEASVAKVVDTIVEYAYHNKASDVHIEPEEEDSLVRFRIDGVLNDVLTLPRNLHERVITRIKVLSQLRTDEHHSAQDGKMLVKLENEDLDIRVSIAPIVEGEKAVLRLLSSHNRQFSLQDLGMKDSDLAKVRNGYEKPTGTVIATGPTGSGKTTSIYAIIKVLNTRDVNIATIEDPVEYTIEKINQIQVNKDTDLTFSNGLRSILRQDPDIIFVGEIRDKDTAQIATDSAMTGHLVLSTLHTNDAATTLPRLIDMDIEPFLVASTVNVIIAQRLVRKICGHCKISQEVPRNEISPSFDHNSVRKLFGTDEKIRVYSGKGCESCHNTGYVGRIGIFEVLEISKDVRQLIMNKADADTIRDQAMKEGMTTMGEDGLEKVARGETTLDEILRVTKE